MENFKLSNLRELSTEEQLRLNGGFGSEASCSCSGCPTCSCKEESNHDSVDLVKDGAKDAVKDAKK